MFDETCTLNAGSIVGLARTFGSAYTVQVVWKLSQKYAYQLNEIRLAKPQGNFFSTVGCSGGDKHVGSSQIRAESRYVISLFSFQSRFKLQSSCLAQVTT